ncbi:hypothetical protein ACFPDQ_05440 [Pseudofrancisella aestuarii]|uniref:DUF4145 domain-containing protein n=1 Tax=Pseudofrancisella aestuarii TaxID=2670347 RepID=A0ABV9TCY7_9GAMM|nr:hypothetical protein [Pseudofrancisella aestuarii]
MTKIILNNIKGNIGESLWHAPLRKFPYQSELFELLDKVKNIKDDRMEALITMLLVENRVDHYLCYLLPKAKFWYETKPTFHSKINLLKSFNLIPPLIIESCILLNKIRNVFAHDLEVNCFKDLEENNHKLLEKLSKNPKSKLADTNDYNSMFSQLRFYVLNALDSYLYNVQAFKDEIYSENMQNKIYLKAYEKESFILKTIEEMNIGESKQVDNDITIIKISKDQTKIFFNKRRPFKAEI